MITISFNGTLFSIPATSQDVNWGAQLTSYLSALAAGAAPLNAASTFTAAVQFAAGLGIGPQSSPPTQNANAQLYTDPSTGQLMAVLPSPQSSTPVRLSNQYSAPTGPANEVFATPNGSSGAAALRALVAADIPALDASKITTGTLASSLLTGVYSGITGLGTLSVPLLISDGSSSAPAVAFGSDPAIGLFRTGGSPWFVSHGAQIAGFVNDHSQTWSYIDLQSLAGSGITSTFSGIQWTGSGAGSGQQIGVMAGYSNGIALNGSLWFASNGAGTVNSFDTGLAPTRPGFSVYSTAVTMNGLNQSTNGGSVGDVSLYTSAIYSAGYDFNLAGLGPARGLVGFAYGGPYGGPALAQTSLGKGFTYGGLTDDPYTGFGFSAAGHASVYVNNSSLPALVADFTLSGMALTGAITGATWAGNAILLSQLAQSGAIPTQVPTWNGSAWVPATPSAPGTGTVTSVAATVPTSVLTISGSPITTSGTLAFGLASSTTPNQVLASATSGSTSTPLAMRTLVAADIPSIPFSQVTGTVGVTQGGTGLTATALGSLLYGSASNVYSSLAGSTSATKQFLTQIGTGTVSAAPAWGTIAAGDIPSTLNATAFSGAITLPNTSKLTDTANGTVQITNASGAFASLLMGAAGATTGILLVPTANTLTINPGDNSTNTNFTLTTGILKGRIVQATGFFESPNGSISQAAYGNTNGTSGLYFPTLTTAALSSNGVAALVFDGSQNATFSTQVSCGTVFAAPFFVQGSISTLGIGQMGRSVITATGAVTLTTLQARDSLVQCTGASAFAITFPAGAVGMHTTIVNRSSATITVTANGSDTIAANGLSAATSRTIAAGGTLDMTFVATNAWYCDFSTGTIA